MAIVKKEEKIKPKKILGKKLKGRFNKSGLKVLGDRLLVRSV